MRFRMFSVPLLIAASTLPVVSPRPRRRFRDRAGHRRRLQRRPPPQPTTDANPAWLAALVAAVEPDGVANPPIKIRAYVYNRATVYFVPQRYCDIFSDLYDESGVPIAHPDGVVAGAGDGRAADFSINARFVRVVRKTRADNASWYGRPSNQSRSSRLKAPPPYRALVVSGLPNGYVQVAHWAVGLDKAARLFTIKMLSSAPEPTSNPLCTTVYATMHHPIPLEDLELPPNVQSPRPRDDVYRPVGEKAGGSAIPSY